MDSINLSETQNTPLNSRNTASNTSPIACSCCGAKDYIQTVPQAFYYPALHPGIPTLPVIPQFFHNPGIPTNFICTHNPLDSKITNEEGKPKNESDKISKPANHYTLSQKDQPRDHTPSVENGQKKNFLGSDVHHLGHPFHIANSPESQYNSLMQRCACGDHSSWTCSPVIAPIISYCLFWNSQKSNISILPTNYTPCSGETLLQKNNENFTNQEYSTGCLDNDKIGKNINTVKDANNNTTKLPHSLQEDSLEAFHDSENNEQNSDNSLASLSFNSLNFNEKSLKDNEKEGGSNAQSKNGSICAAEEDEDEEDTELETLDCMDQLESEECLKMESNNINDEIQSPRDSQSYTDVSSEKKSVKGRVDSSNASYLETQASPSENSAQGENSFQYLQDRNIPKSEKYAPGAAMGDVGGDHCEGYKVNILLYEGEQQNENIHETVTEESFATKELLLKELRELEESIADCPSERSTNENLKSARSQKSGIAKLTNTSKSRESKADFSKCPRQNKEPSQREPSVTKRRHNCFTTDSPMNAITTDNSSKIQKTRNCTVQPQTPGQEKYQKELNSKTTPTKKEDKTSTTKVRTVGNLQKNLKTNYKK